MPISLLIDEGSFAGRRYVFDQDEVSFGRTEENDVVVPSEAASRHHARLFLQDGSFQVEDLRSSNGTRVNGEPLLRPLLLEDGDIIEIGKVRFKFSPYEAANATRIVASAEIPQWEKARAKAPERPSFAAAPPRGPAAIAVARFQALPRRRRIQIGVLGVMMLGFLMIRLARRPTVVSTGPELVDRPIALSAGPDPHAYGLGPGNDRIAPRGITFTFNFSEPVAGKSLLTLHAQVAAVRHADDVDLLLNGQHLAFLPATFDDQRPFDLVLERGKLQPNAENVLAFKPSRAEVTWSVAGVWVEQESLPSGTPAQLQLEAQQEFNLAESKYGNREVASQNLYDSWHHYKRARLVLEAIPKPPAELKNLVTERLREVDNDLDKKCRTMLFTAQQAKVTKGVQAAGEAADNILAYFPQPDHPCYEKSRQFLRGLSGE